MMISLGVRELCLLTCRNSDCRIRSTVSHQPHTHVREANIISVKRKRRPRAYDIRYDTMGDEDIESEDEEKEIATLCKIKIRNKDARLR